MSNRNVTVFYVYVISTFSLLDLVLESTGAILHPRHLHHGQQAPRRRRGQDLVTRQRTESPVGQRRSHGGSGLTGHLC